MRREVLQAFGLLLGVGGGVVLAEAFAIRTQWVSLQGPSARRLYLFVASAVLVMPGLVIGPLGGTPLLYAYTLIPWLFGILLGGGAFYALRVKLSKRVLPRAFWLALMCLFVSSPVLLFVVDELETAVFEEEHERTHTERRTAEAEGERPAAGATTAGEERRGTRRSAVAGRSGRQLASRVAPETTSAWLSRGGSRPAAATDACRSAVAAARNAGRLDDSAPGMSDVSPGVRAMMSLTQGVVGQAAQVPVLLDCAEQGDAAAIAELRRQERIAALQTAAAQSQAASTAISNSVRRSELRREYFDEILRNNRLADEYRREGNGTRARYHQDQADQAREAYLRLRAGQ